MGIDLWQRAVELEWQRTLTPEQFRVLRQKQTEEVNKVRRVRGGRAGIHSQTESMEESASVEA